MVKFPHLDCERSLDCANSNILCSSILLKTGISYISCVPESLTNLNLSLISRKQLCLRARCQPGIFSACLALLNKENPASIRLTVLNGTDSIFCLAPKCCSMILNNLKPSLIIGPSIEKTNFSNRTGSSKDKRIQTNSPAL